MFQALLNLALLIVPIQILHVSGEHGIELRHAKRLIGQAERRYFKPLHIKFTYRPIIGIEGENPFNRWNDVYSRHFYWLEWASRHGLFTPEAIKAFIVPPYISDTSYYLAGSSSGGCFKDQSLNPVLVAAAEYQNKYGDGRWRHSVIVSAHELAHLFGAGHVKTKSIMNPAALSFVDSGRLNFSAESVSQIKKCMFPVGAR